jgi:hypothetical protein
MKSSSTPAANDGQMHDAPLEFPDWSGMVSRNVRMSFERAVQWNEGMLETFPPPANRAALDADTKCAVEFRLP